MYWQQDDTVDRVEHLLWLGKTQQDVADEVGLSIGTVSKYHQELVEREGETYIKVRDRNRRLDKAGLPISEAEDVLKGINKMMEAEDFPDHFSVRDVAAIISLTVRMYDGVGNKHDLTTRLMEVASVVQKLELDIHQIVQRPELLEKKIEGSTPTDGRRNMSEARKQKAIKVLKMSRW